FIKKFVNKFKNSNRVKKLIKTTKFSKNLSEWSIYNEIKKGGFFDAEWYRLAYGVSKKNYRELLLDYLKVGISNGRDPNPYFNTVLYRRAHQVGLKDAFLNFMRSGSDQT